MRNLSYKIILLTLASVIIPIASQAEESKVYKVKRVIDGDTILLNNGERVRLIGVVDTPETVHPSKPVEYYGKEASAFTKRMVEGKKVKLEFDWNSRDKYGRLLVYVYLLDGTFLNAEIVKQGYGHAYTRFPFKYLEEFRQYEREAREAGRGLWAKEETKIEKSKTTPDKIKEAHESVIKKENKAEISKTTLDKPKEDHESLFREESEPEKSKAGKEDTKLLTTFWNIVKNNSNIILAILTLIIIIQVIRDRHLRYRPRLIPIHNPINDYIYPAILADKRFHNDPKLPGMDNIFYLTYHPHVPQSKVYRPIAYIPLRNVGSGPATILEGELSNGASVSWHVGDDRIERAPDINRDQWNHGKLYGNSGIASEMTDILYAELSPTTDKCNDINECLDDNNNRRYLDQHLHRVYFLKVIYKDIFNKKYQLTAYFSPHDYGRWEEVKHKKIRWYRR